MNKARRIQYFTAGAAGLLTFLVFLPALRNGFVNWDDNMYIYDNMFIRTLNPDMLVWAISDLTTASNWHPLTWISHALDYALWGLDPLGHHLTNNILHALNTFLVVLLVARLVEFVKPLSAVSRQHSAVRGQRGEVTPLNHPLPRGEVKWSAVTESTTQPLNYLTSSRFPLIAAAATGLLFGLHPLHVESVAWVSERKDLLCALFYLLSLLMYLKGRLVAMGNGQSAKDEITTKVPIAYRLSPRACFSLSLCFFLLALLSKPMAVTLPLVLLILDWYPLGRISSFSALGGVILEKLPFFAFSLASGVITILAQHSGGAVMPLESLPLATRLIVGIQALVVYLRKMLLPLDLVPVYPYPQEVSLTSLKFFLPVLLAIGITAAAVAVARKQRLWLAAWAYYLITLLPVIGLIQVGRQPMADRYTYLPGLGPFLIAGLAAAWLYKKGSIHMTSRLSRVFGFSVAVALLAILGSLSVKQAAVWKDNFTLWNYVIGKEPREIPSAYNQRGSAFYDEGEYARALDDFSRAIASEPEKYFKAYNNRGMANQKLGRLDEAIADFDKAISIDPEYGKAYNNRGLVYDGKGLLAEAVEDYSRAIALDPDDAAPVYNNRGVAFYKQGMPDKAIEDFSRAITIDPGFDRAYNNRGVAYETKGLTAEARADFRQGCELGHKEACQSLEALPGDKR